MIPGLENEPLVPGEELLGLPGFWAAYLLWLAEGEDYEPEPDALGVDAADADTAFERLTEPAAWPVIRVPLEQGHCISIVYRNFVEDEGIDYYLSHPEWDRIAALASLEGHFSGPGLAWRELIYVANRPGDGPGVTDPHARLLLLLPILGDDELSANAGATVGSALASVGVPAAARNELAEALLDHPYWGREKWYYPNSDPSLAGRSEADEGQILVCTGKHSPRAIPFTLSPNHRTLLARVLGNIG
ncbi:MAG TPA: hypothetical protein VL551_20045 [Actinospica sp.]|jgi:hypothetical protein|nr:hypothetical protein [Actinospica sp.]